MRKLDHLTKEDILHGPLPLMELLHGSFYYPASALDGRVVKWYARHIQSFVYCDYSISEEQFLAEMDGFKGYSIVGQRSVKQQELVPNGWYPVIPRGVNMKLSMKYQHAWKKPFCRWVVYERHADLDEAHGPKRYSLLFLCGEGVATYQALYWTNRTSAKAVGIIRPGDGFGLNWTQFHKEGGPLYQVLMENKYGTPELIFRNSRELDWPDYYYHSEINTCDRFTGKVRIWKKQDAAATFS